MKSNQYKGIANFLFEVGFLAKTPRRGFDLLGSGKQNVAEHTLRVAFIAYALASLEKNVGMEKVLKMALFHDFDEARTGDPTWVNQLYLKRLSKKAITEATSKLPFGKDLLAIFKEYALKQSSEALIVKDADHLELVVTLKEIQDTGRKIHKHWIEAAVEMLRTESAKKLARQVLKTRFDAWWLQGRGPDWWKKNLKETR